MLSFCGMVFLLDVMPIYCFFDYYNEKLYKVLEIQILINRQEEDI